MLKGGVRWVCGVREYREEWVTCPKPHHCLDKGRIVGERGWKIRRVTDWRLDELV